MADEVFKVTCSITANSNQVGESVPKIDMEKFIVNEQSNKESIKEIDSKNIVMFVHVRFYIDKEGKRLLDGLFLVCRVHANCKVVNDKFKYMKLFLHLVGFRQFAYL